jgi:hypothetical protein
MKRSTDTLDFMMQYVINKNFSVGGFLNYSWIDIETSYNALPGDVGRFKRKGQQYGRWGIGLTGSGNFDIGAGMNLGVTGLIASMNKRSLDSILDDHDNYFILTTDIYKRCSDLFAFDAYLNYITLLENRQGLDGHYFTVGLDCIFYTSETVTVTVGYEQNVSNDDIHDHRINASVSIAF